MNSQYVLEIVITVLLSINGVTLTLFVSNVRELKKVIQELSLTIRGSQKDIEFINQTISNHSKTLEKHEKSISNLQLSIHNK